jgi:hypothetical protein
MHNHYYKPSKKYSSCDTILFKEMTKAASPKELCLLRLLPKPRIPEQETVSNFRTKYVQTQPVK